MSPSMFFAIIPNFYIIFLDLNLALDFNYIFACYEDPTLVGVVFHVEHYFLARN